MNAFLRHTLLLTMLLSAAFSMSAQKVTNVTPRQEGNTIVIDYTLSKDALKVELFVSTNGGRTYEAVNSASGDVGYNVTKGKKTIRWNVLNERESFVYDNVVFKITATPKQEEARRTETKWHSPLSTATKKAKKPAQLPQFNEHSGFFGINIGYSSYDFATYGLSFGQLKKWGWMLRLNLGGISEESETRFNMALTADVARMLFSSRVGSLYIYAGLGLGYESYKGDYTGIVYDEHGYISATGTEVDDHIGLAFDFGLLYKVGRVEISAGAISINGSYWTADFSIGYCF
ncbi:MAG: hypothetical protein IAC51_01910 [bacterium]|uniref:Outer membrane protein beta-barrel domain-containing protein n=1 Tax=Candidatus Aphodosoma intestinipullorum TaxID=2840674 RepID=A0A940DI90_9BACT|nr:hypothetical protein [Candidatus Aphodosoma intestinipullorum]